MDSDIEKIITEQMKKLPEDVVAAIISVDYKNKLQDVVKRQKLLIDQIGKLEMETTLVMLGLEPVADFTANLQRELNVTLLRAKEIALDISENIFKPIKDSLKKINEQVEEEDRESAIMAEQEKMSSQLTNSSEVNLNRDQILNEIENPIPNNSSFAQALPREQTAEQINNSGVSLEIRPAQEIKTIPGEEVREATPDILKAKLAGPVITNQQIVNAKPESKLPEIEKKKPYGGIDPYKEPLA